MPIAEAGAAVCKSAAKRPWTVRRAWLRALPFILLTPLGLLLGRLSTLDAAATERLWSTSVYPVLAQCVSAVTGLFPALTLGCGAVGGSSSSNNVSPLDLINIRRVAWGTDEPKQCAPAAEVDAELVEQLAKKILERLG